MRLTHAEIIAVGSELLDGAHPDSNSLQLSLWLANLGICVRAKHVVTDEPEAIAAALRTSLARSPLVLCTGGLGPTWDDCTREAAATALRRSLRPDPRMLAHIRRRYKGRAMPIVNLRQADRLTGALWLHNHHGSAPGQWCRAGQGRFLVLLPGPTREMEAMFRDQVLPRLRRLAPAPLAARLLRVAGLGESAVDERVADLCRTPPSVQVTILANSEPAVELHIRGERRAADRLARQLRARLGSAVFASQPLPLAEVVGNALLAHGDTVAVAESCTGGMLGAQLSAIPGSSRYFLGGVIAYSNEVKRQLLGIPAA
ncbi:MAG: molybdopterin-binding protein, partial [Terriglobales bacterium]